MERKTINITSETKVWRDMFVQAVILLACGWITNGQYEDVSTISIRATKIMSSTDSKFIVREEFHFALFPSLQFTCEMGHVIRLWFIGKVSESTLSSAMTDSGPQIPIFSIWTRTSNSSSFTNGRTLSALRLPDQPKILNNMEPTLVSLRPSSFSEVNFTFTKGDFIGILNPNNMTKRHSMFYHRDSGPAIYFQEEITNTLLKSSSISNDYPLLAIETKPENCTTGFLSLDILESLMKEIVAYPRPGLYIIPALSLMCVRRSIANRGSVKGIIAGGNFDMAAGDTKQLLTIMWWQQITEQTYNLTATTSIANTDLRAIDGHPNAYSFILNMNSDNLDATAGDTGVLGIRITESLFNLYYDANGRGVNNCTIVRFESDSESSQIRIPSTVDVSTGSEIHGNPLLSFVARDLQLNDNCLECVPRPQDVYSSALLIPTLIYTPDPKFRSDFQITGDISGFIYLFHSNPFNTAGSVTSWVFAAKRLEMNSSISSAQLPQLQIWRPRISDGIMYDLHFTTMFNYSPSVLLGALNMYTYSIELYQPASYEQNDIIGIYQPSTANAAFQIAFMNSDDITLQALVQPTTLARTGRFVSEEQMPVTLLPLMTLATKIAIEPSQTQSSSTSSVLMTSKVLDTTSTSSTNAKPSRSRLENGAIIGITVGVLGSIALLMFIIILSLALYIAKKKSNRKKFVVQNDLPLSPIANQAVDPLGNPTYTGASSLGIDRVKYHGGPIATMSVEEYEVPVEILSQFGRSSGQGANASLDTQDTSQPYETPMISPQNNHMEKHIYHILETPTENHEGQTDEVEIYVPAGDHRRVLSSLTSAKQQTVDVYATLTESQFSTMRSDGSYFVESGAFWKPASDQEQLYHQLYANKYREISHHNIKITDKLGSGEFGEVSKGTWTKTRGMCVDVAVKTLKSAATEDDRVSFLQEAAIMGQFRHPNIVTLMGVVTIGNPVMIVIELLVNGDLRSYLKQQKPSQSGKVSPDWPVKLLNFCQHIAAGMDYLHKKGFIHRDLAARNILVAANSTCKISDFGLSRDLEEENYYVSKGGMIPVKWTAPEALNFKKFSPPCDVWSYGIVMYEIWSLGNKPYKHIKNMEVLPKVESGYRLPPPPGCPREVYRIMIQCWHPEGSCRPTFSEVLDSLLQPESELLYWSEADDNMGVHRLESTLGAPLQEGEQLYPELQSTYMSVYEAANVPLQ